MLNFSQQKQNTPQKRSSFVYNILDKITYLFIKLTFPFWVIPYFTIVLCLQILNFWRHIRSLISNLLYLNTPPQLAYALLKGNGQYLRDKHEKVLIRQFYDYTSRKFMSISQLDKDLVIVQLQCSNDIGINYLSQCAKPENVKGLVSDLRLVRNISWPQNKLKITKYAIQGEPQQVDCFLLFNFKSKVNFLGKSSVDLIKILDYCSYHLRKDGYLVFGDYFEQGQLQTFAKLFHIYKFEIVEQEDITKNIEYANKLLSKDRLNLQLKFFSFFKNFCFSTRRQQQYEFGKSFYVLILQSKERLRQLRDRSQESATTQNGILTELIKTSVENENKGNNGNIQIFGNSIQKDAETTFTPVKKKTLKYELDGFSPPNPRLSTFKRSSPAEVIG